MIGKSKNLKGLLKVQCKVNDQTLLPWLGYKFILFIYMIVVQHYIPEKSPLQL